MLLGETGPLPAAGTVGGGTTGRRGYLCMIIYKQGVETDYYHASPSSRV